ncbi:aminoglycoside phosphotransferase [Nonomuraea sp. MG754425]|uniref:phosphotransferase n=1 Tax=Nonomuraea sp. MG754425 TaxID=2570319 RepID=UPI001F3237CE|nr:phosphotransferase [Nonomuraea sp. MG754425]MCF6475744.1 aminoglycoside phosphotransferase [Nonomuraea sp. MG754425]
MPAADIDWDDLPLGLVRAVRKHTGRVTGSRSAKGVRSDYAATLETASGPVFVKGAGQPLFAASLAHEAATVAFVPGIAPRLLWRIDAAGWVMLGFEHVEGRHADYRPGSPDLPLLAHAVTQLGQVPLPEHVSKRVERHYNGLPAMSGNHLLHTDLHPANVLVSGDRAVLVDWAWACKGAAWVEPAMLAFRLMAAGHSVEGAEDWGRGLATWQDGTALDEFVIANHRSWRRAADLDPLDWKVRAAGMAHQWSVHRRLAKD